MAANSTDPRTYLVLNNSSELFFDALVRITPKFSARVSSHPIEGGSRISDNVALMNATISLSAVMSDADLRGVQSVELRGIETVPTTVASASGRSILDALIIEAKNKIPDNVIVEYFSKKPDEVSVSSAPRRRRVGNTRDNLLEAFQLKEIISLVEGDTTYTNLIITSLAFPKDSPEDGVLHIDMELEQVDITSSLRQTLTIVEVAASIQEQAAQNTEGGTVTPTVKSPEEEVLLADELIEFVTRR